MANLPAVPFTQLTVERTDADSPLDESLMQDIGIDLNFLKAGVDSLQDRMDLVEIDVSTLQSEMSDVQADVTTLQADVTTLQNDISGFAGDRILAWAAM